MLLAGSAAQGQCQYDPPLDGTVGMFDLVSLLMSWGPAGDGCQFADFDLDGNVAVPDLLILLANWR